MASDGVKDKQHWNEAAEAYAPFEAFSGQFTSAAAERLVDELLSTDAEGELYKLMDVAAGTGASTFAIAQVLTDRGRKAEIVATDFSEGMITKLRGHLAEESSSAKSPELQASLDACQAGTLTISAEVADAQSLTSFQDGSLSAINCSFGIMFPPAPEKVVEEFWRLLKPGGLACCLTWHYNRLASDIAPDLAHKFMGKPRFTDLMPEITPFSQEAYMRRLFRGDLGDGDALWSDADIRVQFVSKSLAVDPSFMAAGLNKNPLTSTLGHWDEAAALEHLKAKWAHSDGLCHIFATALILIARKPS